NAELTKVRRVALLTFTIILRSPLTIAGLRRCAANRPSQRHVQLRECEALGCYARIQWIDLDKVDESIRNIPYAEGDHSEPPRESVVQNDVGNPCAVVLVDNRKADVYGERAGLIDVGGGYACCDPRRVENGQSKGNPDRLQIHDPLCAR